MRTMIVSMLLCLSIASCGREGTPRTYPTGNIVVGTSIDGDTQ